MLYCMGYCGNDYMVGYFIVVWYIMYSIILYIVLINSDCIAGYICNGIM